MEEKKANGRVWRMAADSTAARLKPRAVEDEHPVMDEDPSAEVAREYIVKEMMRIFDSLLGCTPKRSGVNLGFMHAYKAVPASGTQRKLEQEIYRTIKGLVERNSPNTGFAVNVLANNCQYYFNKASVPLSFSIFLTSLVEYLDAHDCLGVSDEDMMKLKVLIGRS